jgi:tetratricopeptide (TPR) repeat protein
VTSGGATRRGAARDAASWLPLAAFALAVAAYANAASGEFVFEDLTLIVDNEAIATPSRWPRVFAAAPGAFGTAVNAYRPLPSLFFLLLRAAGVTGPGPFHLLSIACHAVATTLVFVLAARLLGRTPLACWAAFGGAALFAVHPVHVEAVAWASGLAIVACACCSMGAILAYVRADEDGRRGPFIAASLASLALALLCHESALVVPVAIAGYDLLVRRDLVRSSADVARRWAPVAAVAAAYGLTRTIALGGLVPVDVDGGSAAWSVAAAWPQLLAAYVRLYVAPVGLTVMHDVPAMLAHDAAALAACSGGLAVGGLACWYARRAGGTAAFGVLLFLLGLAPALAAPLAARELSAATFAERFLYLPSAGASIALAAALARAGGRSPAAARGFAVCLAVVAVAFGGMTRARNRTWNDGLSLWSDAAAKSPGVAAARESHGLALLGRGRSDAGTRELQAALALSPGLPARWIDAGTAWARQGRTTQAIRCFQTALLYRPADARAHYNLAVAFERMGWNRDAIAEYKATIAGDPGHADAHNNLGIIYAQTYRPDEALEQFSAAVRSRPDDAELRSNLARAYDAKGLAREAEAERARVRALERPPR